MKRNISLKYGPVFEEVELIERTARQALVRLPDGREKTVPIHNLEPKIKSLGLDDVSTCIYK